MHPIDAFPLVGFYVSLDWIDLYSSSFDDVSCGKSTLDIIDRTQTFLELGIKNHSFSRE